MAQTVRKWRTILSAMSCEVAWRVNSYVEGNRIPFETFRAGSRDPESAMDRAPLLGNLRVGQAFALELVGDFKHRPSFGDLHRVDVNVAAGNFPKDLPLVHRLIEKIFAGLQRAIVMPAAQEFERHGIGV